jgi:hypothetical protein
MGFGGGTEAERWPRLPQPPRAADDKLAEDFLGAYEHGADRPCGE